MTIGEIADLCSKTVGDIDQDTVAFAKQAIRMRYQLLYASHNWQESIAGFQFNLADTDTFWLPLDAELIIWVVPFINGIKYSKLAYRERDWIEQHAAIGPYFSNYGPIPSYFYRAPNVALPSVNAGTLSFRVLDTSPISIYVAGKDTNGNPTSEKFSASTATPGTPSQPSSHNTYSVVSTISKDVSAFPVTVSATDGSSATMSPGQTSLVFTQGTMWPPLVGSGTFYVGAKLRADTLEDDLSVPRVSRLWNILISYTNAALLKRQRQWGKAQAETQEALQLVSSAVNEEKNQAAFRQQVVPASYDGNFFPWGSAAYPTTTYPWGGY
jgi:hypothetical protein